MPRHPDAAVRNQQAIENEHNALGAAHVGDSNSVFPSLEATAEDQPEPIDWDAQRLQALRRFDEIFRVSVAEEQGLRKVFGRCRSSRATCLGEISQGWTQEPHYGNVVTRPLSALIRGIGVLLLSFGASLYRTANEMSTPQLVIPQLTKRDRPNPLP